MNAEFARRFSGGTIRYRASATIYPSRHGPKRKEENGGQQDFSDHGSLTWLERVVVQGAKKI
ncbi:hypothetical protein [Cupriavidus necator]